ncbi:MAG: PKD domain-containing protein, partial [Planctomycetota bacterium]
MRKIFIIFGLIACFWVACGSTCNKDKNSGVALKASFTAIPTSGDAPLTVDFTDTSTGSVTHWEWDLDYNGIIDSTLQNPSRLYTTPGTYTVKLTVIGDNDVNVLILTDFITVTAGVPVAEFTATPVTGTAPLEVTFTDDSNGDVDLWEWDFNNDGAVDSTEQHPVYTYTDPGEYTVKLTVSGIGGTNETIKTAFIKVTGSWSTIRTAPILGRWDNTAVWTGTHVIIWGGYGSGIHFNDGAKYSQATNTWIVLNTAPILGRCLHSAVWTGTEMIVWGGTNGVTDYGDGAKFNPATGIWTTLSPCPLNGRYNHKAIWTGSEMIVWGGQTGSGSYFANGAKYNPMTDAWTMLSAFPLSGRAEHSAVWTGSEMIIWGGYNGITALDNGARYNPATNSWTTLNAVSISGRRRHSAVWTGTKMVIWGGGANDG